MDPATDSLAASTPFPTIPAATNSRPRVAKPRRHAAPFRSDYLGASSSSPVRRFGGDSSSFAFGAAGPGPGSRPSTSGVGSRPAAFVFGGGAASSFGVEDYSASATPWGSARDAGFVFGSGLSGPSEMKSRSSSFGSGDDASLSSLSATVDELVLDDLSGKQSDANADVSGGNDLVLDMNGSDGFGACGSSLNLQEAFVPSIRHGDAGMLNEGRGVPSQTTSYGSMETSSSLTGRVVNSAIWTEHNVSMELGNDGSKASANAGDVEVFVFGEPAIARHRRSAANTDRTNIRKVDSSDKEDATDSSEQPIFSASGPQCDENAEVSHTSLPDSMQTQSTIVGASRFGASRSFDDKSFTLHDHNAASRDKGGVKGMIMNRRVVKPKKFSSVRQVSALQTGFATDNFSGKVAPETNLHLEGIVSFRLQDSGICVGNSDPKEGDASRTTESSHDGMTGFNFVATSQRSGKSDFKFGSFTFDQSKLHSLIGHNKKDCGGMSTHVTADQSSLAHSDVSASQPSSALAAQWTEQNKAEHKTAPCTKAENFGYHEDCETWRIRGNQAYAEGQLAKAEECYTHGINSFSPNETSRKTLLLCYSNRAATRMSLGRMREALSDCRKATDIDSSFLKAQVRAANCLLALGDVEEAQNGFEICLKSNDVAGLEYKFVEEASAGLQKAQKVSSIMLQSKEYIEKKEFDKMLSALQMISDALSISAYSDNLMKLKAEALLLLRRYEEVIRFCEETLHLAEPNSVSMCLDEQSKNINVDDYICSVKLWRYYLIAKSYFLIGKLEEAHQILKKHEHTTLHECKCGKQSQQSLTAFSLAISELLRLKAAGNEAFQAGKYSEAVEHYTAALLRNTESLHFSAICFGNRAAAYQAMGQILDAIADCSLAIALDASYSKVISRRASLYELIRDYGQAENDLRRLISLLEKQLQENRPMPPEKSDNIRNNLHRANLRLSALERAARKRTSLNIYLILGIEPSCSALDIKKAYRKAALRHHPDKAGNFLVRSENIDDTSWRDISNEIRRDADYLFKIIGKAYAMLSDPTMKSK